MTKLELQQHYQALWQQSLVKFEQQQFETDALLTAREDSRYGVTLLARPSEQVKQQIRHHLAELMQLEPQQYYYPASDLHLTVLSLISCYSGFALSQIDTAAYVELVKVVMKNIGPFRLHFQGITASPSCVLVQGFFDDQQLNQLREQLRSAFQARPPAPSCFSPLDNARCSHDVSSGCSHARVRFGRDAAAPARNCGAERHPAMEVQNQCRGLVIPRAWR